jgi:ribosomal protein L23
MGLFTKIKKSAQGGPVSGQKNTSARTESVRSGGEKVAAPAERTNNVAAPDRNGGAAGVLQNPRITEKATMHSGEGVYTFDVADSATKRDILKAVRSLYSVSPRKVAIVRVPKKWKRNARTGKRGMQGGGKKAYVYLKKGETITIV